MKRYKGFTASPGLVLGQVSRLERPPLVFGEGPFHPEQEKQALEDAIQLAQKELNDMADRAAPTEQAIFLFQSMMLEDEGFMNEVNFQIRAGVGAAEAMDRVGRRYAAQLSAMKDNAYMQLRSVDILDVTQRITNILCRRPRSWLALDHPVIIASDLLMPTDLFSIPSGRILGLITAEGSGQSHAAITRICELQRQNEELNAQLELPNRTRDGEEFELLANCFGPEDVGTAMSSGASGVGLLRSSYMMLPGHAMDEQEQYLFYTSCLAAAKGKMVTVRTFDFGADRTMADAYQGVQSSKLGLRGIRSSLRNLPQMAVQICALMRAAAKGPLRVMFPMVTDIEDWDSAMQVVDHCRRKLAERGEEFEPDVPFGVMLSIPAACLTAEDFTAHGCRFFVIGTNDLTQYTHAVSRELAIAEHYYRPASPAMKKLIAMVVDAAKKADIPVTICGLAVGNAVNATQYLRLGLRSFSMSPQNLLAIKKALRDAETR